MGKYKAIVFDLDGTLLDTLADLRAGVNYALSQKGFPLRTMDEIRSFVGNGIASLNERSAPAGTPKSVCDELLTLFRAYYDVHSCDTTAPYDGILPLLDTLIADGIQIAVVSNKVDAAVQALCRRYFGDRVKIAVGEREGVARKPSPDSVFYALDVLSCDKTQAIYVGDSDVDIQTANNAGLDSISVTWGFRDKTHLLSHGASHIADQPADILKFIS